MMVRLSRRSLSDWLWWSREITCAKSPETFVLMYHSFDSRSS